MPQTTLLPIKRRRVYVCTDAGPISGGGTGGDVVVVCKYGHSPRSEEVSEGRDAYSVWLGNTRRDFDSKEKAMEYGRQLAAENMQRLWLQDGDYPPALLWPPDDDITTD